MKKIDVAKEKINNAKTAVVFMTKFTVATSCAMFSFAMSGVRDVTGGLAAAAAVIGKAVADSM